jgi:hypothetical protein
VIGVVMKITTLVPLISLLTLAAAASAQDNSCAYTFTYPKQHFSFCVNVWGTLSSIQSPIGVNHLNSQNPVEGWTANIEDDGGGGDGAIIIPGLGVADFTHPPAVTQPKGIGTLPLIFTYGSGNNMVETVNANPYEREIYLTLTIRSCNDCFWTGAVSRVANLKVDGSGTNTFAHASFAAFGYLKHGVMLSVDENAPGSSCAGADPDGTSTSAYSGCLVSTAPFVGTGRVFTFWFFESSLGKPMRMRATYRVF